MTSVNMLNRRYRITFMKAMRLLKPKKSQYPRGGYGKAVRAWQQAISFSSILRREVNNLNNKIILKGKKNRSK